MEEVAKKLSSETVQKYFLTNDFSAKQSNYYFEKFTIINNATKLALKKGYLTKIYPACIFFLVIGFIYLSYITYKKFISNVSAPPLVKLFIMYKIFINVKNNILCTIQQIF
jgi:hypothetical protein